MGLTTKKNIRNKKCNQSSCSKCSSNEICRDSYVTKSGKRVPAKCIRSHGAGPGKRKDWQKKEIKKMQKKLAKRGKTLKRDPSSIIVLRKGGLKEFGYTNVQKKSAIERRSALKKAIDVENSFGHDGPVINLRRVNVLSLFSKNKYPKRSAIYKKDVDWIRKTYKTGSLKHRKSSSKKRKE